jgi:hypothetical protein
MEGLKMIKSINSWVNYGDVNPLVYGGIWIKKFSSNEFYIVRNFNDNDCSIIYCDSLMIDITESWIEKERVMNYIGMTYHDFDSIQFAIGCIEYYSYENFGNRYKLNSQDELIEELKQHDIEI